MLSTTSKRLSFRIPLALAICLAVLLGGLKPASATPLAPLFATTTGTDITCSQSYPCNLATAVSLAADQQCVYVAGGIYTGVVNPMLTINKDVRLTGGWDGASSGPVVVDPVAYLTVLDGEDARRVIEVRDSATPIISGFTITRGYHSSLGGGIYIENSPLVQILDNIFSDNNADTYGGGLYIDEGIIEIERCRFEANEVDYGGGALMLANGVSATMVDNTFTGNTASYGAAFHSDKASVTFYNNYVLNNLGTTSTAAIMLNGTVGYEINFYNNIIAGNIADGVKVQSYTLKLYHNTFADNGRDGLYIDVNAHVVLTNNIFSGHDGTGDNSIYLSGSGAIDSSTNNLFWNNTNDDHTGTNPVFGDPKFYGVYHLLPNSAARDSGASTFITWDIDHQARASGGVPDIGADETLPVYIPLVMK
jgi:hypothetical protein